MQDRILTYSEENEENARKFGDILTGIQQKRRIRKKSIAAPPIKKDPVESPPTTASTADEKLDNPNRQSFLNYINCVWNHFDFDKDGMGCKVWGVAGGDTVDGEDSLYVQKEFSRYVALFISFGHSAISSSNDEPVIQSLIIKKGKDKKVLYDEISETF